MKRITETTKFNTIISKLYKRVKNLRNKIDKNDVISQSELDEYFLAKRMLRKTQHEYTNFYKEKRIKWLNNRINRNRLQARMKAIKKWKL